MGLGCEWHLAAQPRPMVSIIYKKNLYIVFSLTISCLQYSADFFTLFWCCYITVDYETTALQNGACTCRCISKPIHYKFPSSHNAYMKSLGFYENYITLLCMKKINFLTILYQHRTMHGVLTKVVEITI
jgi:hypothetical protein